jgi:spore germination cell wall hydrolase CwlJ-like protein
MPKSISTDSFKPTVVHKEHRQISLAKKNQKEINCLARNIYFEARGETVDGKIAVGVVTINRLVSNLFPNSICSVVYQQDKRQEGNTVCQFEWVCREELKEHVPQGPAWKESKRIATLLVNNGYYIYYKLVDGALFFHADYLPFSWDRQYRRVAKVGQHIFYRPKR